MTTVTSILRYPLKSHGREALEAVVLKAGCALPYDRQWAVAHEGSKADGSKWAHCANFSRASKAPELMAITCQFDPEQNSITLSHPKRPDIIFDPDGDPAAFLEWVTPLVPQNRALPARILKLPDRGFTDSDFPSVTLCNLASHRAVEKQVGQSLSVDRWRGNIWFDTQVPWEEFDWMDQKVKIGEAIFHVQERTDRCLATTANPKTGERDVDILKALDHWNHQDFSVRATVVTDGKVQLGDRVELL